MAVKPVVVVVGPVESGGEVGREERRDPSSKKCSNSSLISCVSGLIGVVRCNVRILFSKLYVETPFGKNIHAEKYVETPFGSSINILCSKYIYVRHTFSL